MNTVEKKQFPEMTLYVLVRTDLAGSYRMSQGTHAVADYAIEHSDMFRRWDNGRMIFLGVMGLKAIRDWVVIIAKWNIVFNVYEELDLDNQMTAIACIAYENEYEVFKGLNRA